MATGKMVVVGRSLLIVGDGHGHSRGRSRGRRTSAVRRVSLFNPYLIPI